MGERYDPYGYTIHPGQQGYACCGSEEQPREMTYMATEDEVRRLSELVEYERTRADLWKAAAIANRLRAESWYDVCEELGEVEDAFFRDMLANKATIAAYDHERLTSTEAGPQETHDAAGRGGGDTQHDASGRDAGT